MCFHLAGRKPHLISTGTSRQLQTPLLYTSWELIWSQTCHEPYSQGLAEWPYALHKFRHVLRNPHLNKDIKHTYLKTDVVPAMRFSMEVWFPRTQEEKQGDAQLLVDALQKSHGIPGHIIICVITGAI
jgi:hypothetical protein